MWTPPGARCSTPPATPSTPAVRTENAAWCTAHDRNFWQHCPLQHRRAASCLVAKVCSQAYPCHRVWLLLAGHSATAGASGAVIAEFFGADTPFEIGTEFPGLAPRTYNSIQEVSGSAGGVGTSMDGCCAAQARSISLPRESAVLSQPAASSRHLHCRRPPCRRLLTR